MAITNDESGSMVMPVSPMMGGNGGLGFGGSNDWLILFILLLCGGWGNGFGGFGGYGGMGAFAADGAMLYPWMNQSNQIHDGFRDQMTNSTINGIQNAITSGFGDVQLGIAGINQGICQATAGVTQAVNNGFSQAEVANNARQMANMQSAFANQSAMLQGFSNVQSQIAQSGSNNQLAACQLSNTVQNEGNATRFSDANNTRDIITNQTANTQAILDKLCALELDGVKSQLAQAERDNVALQNQLNMAALRESQTAQNAFIQQGFSNEVDQLYNRLNSCPVPTTPVYGRTPIFTCNQNQGCSGCGCGNF